MEIIPDAIRQAWSKFEISILVLTSLLLQILLIFFSLFRQRCSSYLLSFMLWLSYLGADYVATLALGNLLNQQNQALNQNTTGDLAAFWGPFLLLHLGGPDTITSYSIEDNQLWLRHLLGLVLQVATAIFVFLESLPSPHLWRAAIVVFSAGILKYGERTWSLRSASMDHIRESMLIEPEKFSQEFRSRRNAGLPVKIMVVKETWRALPEGEAEDLKEEEIIFWAHRFFQTFKLFTVNLMLSNQDRIESQNFFLQRSYKHAFQVVDTELSLLHDMLHTKAVQVHTGMGRTMRFLSLTMAVLALVLFYRAKKEDFKPREIRITYILLIAALAIEVIAIVRLVFSDWTIIALQQSDRLSHPWISRINKIVRGKKLARLIVKIRRLVLGKIAMRKWSNSMGQYSLIHLCLRDYMWARLESFVRHLGLKHGVYIWLKNKWDVWLRETWDGWFHAKQTVSDELKHLIFDELKKKAAIAQLEPNNYKRFRSCRGEWVLRENGYAELDWSVKKEFDESILLWHIATHLCYIEDHIARKEENKNIWSAAEPEKDVEQNRPSATVQDEKAKLERAPLQISRKISEYLMFLVVFKPSMLPAGIGKLRFQDTCAETMKFFTYKDTDISEALEKQLKSKWKEGAPAGKANSMGWKDTLRTIGSKVMKIWKRKEPKLISRAKMKEEKEAAACKVLMTVETSINPIEVKGDRSKSVLFDACKLVKEIQDLFKERREKKWEVISAVWVEMLCYAAGNCGADAHARQLSQGGELLTHVWLLMVHSGIGEQYRIEADRGTAKLLYQG